MDMNGNNSRIFEDPEADPFDPYEYEIGTQETILKFFTDYVIFALRFILCIAIVVCSVLFIYAVYKFKRLRMRTNFILVNYFICSSCYSVCLTITTALESYSDPIHNYHTLNLITFGSLDASILFALLLGVDWFLSANCKRVFAKYKTIYQWIIAAVYLLILIYFICFELVLFLRVTPLFVLITFIIYILSALSLAILNLIKRRRTYSQDVLKSSYILTISNAFFLLFLPCFLIIICGVTILALHDLPFLIIIIFACICYILGLVANSSPIVILILLVKLDKNFRLSYHNLLKASVRRCMDPDNDIADNYLDVDEPEQVV